LSCAQFDRYALVPTRLFALKHGATLVWGPEIVDKAILHAKREVDRASLCLLNTIVCYTNLISAVTGVVSYNGVTRAIFTTHPIEKPHLIYQIGSSDPDLAVQAAKVVMQDVSGIDLNCGCPKPFSTHAGMGAALLTNPDLLCSILTALRKEMPPHITVTAKIRLLPSQEDTLKLVDRIVDTGINALTVHCRTRSMRDKDKALIERLRAIVNFVAAKGKGIAVIENGDCLGWEDARKVRSVTGAHSVMIARAAESNPSCFSADPLKDVERNLWPAYLRLVRRPYSLLLQTQKTHVKAKYLDNHWSLTKFCVTQFKGARIDVTKAESHGLHQKIAKAKSYSEMQDIMGGSSGEEDMQSIVTALEERPPREHRMMPPIDQREQSPLNEYLTVTPQGTQNPEPPGSGAPYLPHDFGKTLPFPNHNATTPTPSGIGVMLPSHPCRLQLQ